MHSEKDLMGVPQCLVRAAGAGTQIVWVFFPIQSICDTLLLALLFSCGGYGLNTSAACTYSLPPTK